MLSRFTATIFLLLVFSCVEKNRYELAIPDGFPEPEIPERNPLSEEGIELGRMVFYDPSLSSNSQVSCATCHLQALAFTDGQPVSGSGVSGQLSLRNAPTLANLAFLNYYFWDGGARDLESQAFAPLMHSNEMSADLAMLTLRMNANSEYRKRFRNVFGQDSITSASIARALAQFQRTLISANSRYDMESRGEYVFTDQEKQGLDIFREKCSVCHRPPLFTDNSFHNNGLDSTYSTQHEGIGLGRYRITLLDQDMGKFKTPTLRNIELTAPYMHDGRFTDLEQVLDHYETGIQITGTLDSLLMDPIQLDPQDRENLILFLNTLTDKDFIKNERFSNPF